MKGGFAGGPSLNSICFWKKLGAIAQRPPASWCLGRVKV